MGYQRAINLAACSIWLALLIGFVVTPALAAPLAFAYQTADRDLEYFTVGEIDAVTFAIVAITQPWVPEPEPRPTLAGPAPEPGPPTLRLVLHPLNAPKNVVNDSIIETGLAGEVLAIQSVEEGVLVLLTQRLPAGTESISFLLLAGNRYWLPGGKRIADCASDSLGSRIPLTLWLLGSTFSPGIVTDHGPGSACVAVLPGMLAAFYPADYPAKLIYSTLRYERYADSWSVFTRAELLNDNPLGLSTFGALDAAVALDERQVAVCLNWGPRLSGIRQMYLAREDSQRSAIIGDWRLQDGQLMYLPGGRAEPAATPAGAMSHSYALSRAGDELWLACVAGDGVQGQLVAARTHLPLEADSAWQLMEPSAADAPAFAPMERADTRILATGGHVIICWREMEFLPENFAAIRLRLAWAATSPSAERLEFKALTLSGYDDMHWPFELVQVQGHVYLAHVQGAASGLECRVELLDSYLE